MRYFPGSASGEGGWGSPESGVLLDEGYLPFTGDNDFTVTDADGSQLTINLEFALVHEIEHAMGLALENHMVLPHGQESEWIATPNTVPCAGT